MPSAPIPLNEHSRYMALMGYHLRKNVLGDAGSDRLVTEAVHRFHVPQSAIALVGQSTVYFLAEHGAGFHTLPREISFCGYAIHDPVPLIVEDARLDPRFADNPLVIGRPFVRFYAGAPLVDRDGYCLGTFCLVDTETRSLAAGQVAELVGFAERAMQRIDFLSTVAQLLSQPGGALLT